MTRQKKARNIPQERKPPFSEEMYQAMALAPMSYMHPSSCNEAWTAWYGSMSKVTTVRNEIINSGIRLEGFTRSDLKMMEDGQLIATVLLDDKRRAALQEQIGQDRVLDFSPQSALASKTSEIMGDELYNKLNSQIKTLPSMVLLDMTKAAFPQLGEVMEVGGFSHEIVTAGLMLRPLLDIYEKIAFRPNDVAIDFCMDMIVHLYLQMIPVDDIRDCILSDLPRFDSLYVLANESEQYFDIESPIFGGEIAEVASFCNDVLLHAVGRRSTHSQDIDGLLETIQSLSIATSSDSRLTRFTIQSVVEEANFEWWNICKSLEIMNTDPGVLQAANIDTGSELLPEMLLMQTKLDLNIVDSARIFLSKIRPLMLQKGYREQASEIQDAIDKLNEEIAEAATNGKGDFELLGLLSSQGADLSRKKNALVTELLSTAETVSTLSNAFMGMMMPPAHSQALLPAPGQLLSENGTISNEATESDATNNIEEELLGLNMKLEADLKAAQAEIYRLSSAYSALQSRLEVPAGTVDQDFSELARKHVQGNRLTPEELLRFFGKMAPDRVLVLESAWRSSRQSENFAKPERLTEHLSKLIYEYLDQVREGTPMGQAGREIFAGAFAARESQTVSQDHSLRAQREFNYAGETRYFEYRLRTGNGWGAVEGLRIYFDVIDSKVVIAYVGPHLDQPSTN